MGKEKPKTMRKRIFLVLLLAGLLVAACQAEPTGTVPQPAPTSDAAEPLGTQPPVPDYPAPDQTQPAAEAPTAPGGESELFMAYPPAPGDENLDRGELFIDSVTLLPTPDKPGQVEVAVEGSLPTPCHQPRFDVLPPDAQNRIVIQAYTLVDKNMMCAQVIQPFSAVVVTLNGYPSGTYTVAVNDQPAGEFTIP
jgi:hypothetical protein